MGHQSAVRFSPQHWKSLMIRRSVVAVLVLAAALSAGADATGRATLDGQRKTSHAYTGTLSGPSVYTGAPETAGSGSVRPRREWCTAQTCDITDLSLRLPAGRQSGRLVVDLTYSGSARMRLTVYASDGTELASQGSCCLADRVVATQLAAGDYSVVVFDEAGAGRFNVSVSWKANPPHRSSSTPSD
ncbi:MAG TPA: hypothetical protein VNB94_01780 [Mycobacteriales bacterium]|nr:hypothetical protein [Mycobacteriales bacterium]